MRDMPPAIRTALDTVRARLEAGFVPRYHTVPREAAPRWARLAGRRFDDAGPVTDPEGVVLDHLAYVDAQEPEGASHVHWYCGSPIYHTHTGGDRQHQHTPHEAGPPAGAMI